MSEIRVTRPRAWADKLRAYQILVDGETVGEIREGSELTIPVPPGLHAIQLRIDWCSSPEIHVAVDNGRTESVSCGPRFNPFLALLAISVFRRRYLWTKFDLHSGRSAVPA
jgi:hypothetical protein